MSNKNNGGFYYDMQLDNPVMTVTLHPNTYISSLYEISERTPHFRRKDPFREFPSEAFKWELFNRGTVDCLDKLTENTYTEGNGTRTNPSECYRKDPLIKSILTEDFQISITNQWGDANGGSEIEDVFNRMKTMAPYQDKLSGMFGNIGNALESLANKSDTQNGLKKAATFGAGWAKKLGTAIGNAAEKLNGALVVQGTRFSYYCGTATNFGNLSMRFTLFPDWKIKKTGKGKEVVEFVTVQDQLNEIYPYVMGKYTPLNLDLGKDSSNSGLKAASDFISSYIGWQLPPAGFRADTRSIDMCQKGTMRLVLGGYYTIENLVIENLSVNFSKAMCKVPSFDGKMSSYNTNNVENIPLYQDGQITPLYADVTLTLKPASSYTNQSLTQFAGGKGIGRIQEEISKERLDYLEEEANRRRNLEPGLVKGKVSVGDSLTQMRNNVKNFSF